MYLNQNKLYALGGESVIQYFPEESTKPRQQDNGSSLDITDSLYVSNLNQKAQGQKKYNESDEPYIPKDLGRDYYDFLQNEYYKKNGVKTTDAQSLFSMWQILKRREMNDTQKKQENFLKTQQRAEESSKQMSIEAQQRLTGAANGFKSKPQMVQQDKTSKLRTILSSNREDIQYTLKVHEEEAQQDMNITKYLENRSEQLQKEKRSKQEKKISKEVQQRLYGSQTQPIKGQEKKDPNGEFVNKIFEWKKQRYPKAVQDYKTPEATFKIWEEIYNKGEDPILNKNPDDAKEEIEKYYMKKMDKIEQLHESKMGFKPEKVGPNEKVGKKGGLAWFWSNKLSADDKKKHDVNFESQDNLESNVKWYQEQKEKQVQKQRENKKKEQEKQDKKKKEELEKSQINQLEQSKTKSEIHQEKLDKLSQPKERLKLGKQLLKLKQMFPGDKTLQKMIYHEFAGTKLAKYPCEYDVYDSDEEDLRKGCYNKDPKKEGGFIVYEDLDRPQKEKEKQMTQLFKKELTEYKEKNQEMTKSCIDKEKQERNEDQQIDRFMTEIAVKFIELRKRRLEQKIPSLHEYLATSYQEMEAQCKEGTKRKYPNYAWGQKKSTNNGKENQDNQKESKIQKESVVVDKQEEKKLYYPMSFKHDFFIRVKQIVKTTAKKQNSKMQKLGFWCPVSSSDGKCKIHISRDCPPDCKYQSLNRRVVELSRFALTSKNNQRKENQEKKKGMAKSVWSQKEYEKERMTIMMTYSDASECTFQPKLEKNELQNQRAEDQKKIKTLQDWVDHKFGENFKHYPRIYKEGNFRRAVILWQQGNYILSYRKLIESFNIPNIKTEFKSKYFPFNNPNSMYSYKNLKVEEEDIQKRPSENFTGKKSFKLMQDVYQLVQYLEEVDRDILRAKKEIDKKINENQRNAVFQQAAELYEKQEYARAYKKIQYNFNIADIKQFIEKEAGGTSDFNSTLKMNQGLKPEVKQKLNLDYKLIESLPPENYSNPKVAKLFRNAYRLSAVNLFLYLKNQKLSEDQMNNPFQKHHDFTYDHEQEDASLDYNERKQTQKSFMCPLGSACPADIRPRWPQSDKKTIYPFGSKCPFAHHISELKFQFLQRTELKQKNKMMKDMLTSITNRLGADPQMPKWNCGGATFTECIGCGDRIGKKWSKGICATCSLRKDQLYKLLAYSAAAKKKYKQITSKKQFAEKQSKRLINEQNLNKKIGYLQQANILYNRGQFVQLIQFKERYSEAFKVIIKAVEIVKLELADFEIEQKNQHNQLKKTLKIDQNLQITKEMAYLPPNQSDKSGTMQQGQIQYSQLAAAGGPDAPFQTIRLYAQKSGIIGEQPINVNDFVNHQIELMYKKIDAALGHSVKDIALMKKRIDKLEGTEELDQQPISEESGDEGKQKKNYQRQKKIIGTKKEMCKELLELGVCKHFNDPAQPCPYAHFPYELDLVENESKVVNLQQAIRNVEERLLQSLPPRNWNPVSSKDAIQSIQAFDEKEDLERLMKGKSAKRRDPMLAKTIYSQELTELSRPPNERIQRNDEY